MLRKYIRKLYFSSISDFEAELASGWDFFEIPDPDPGF